MRSDHVSLTELSRSWLVVAWLSVVEDLPRDGARDEHGDERRKSDSQQDATRREFSDEHQHHPEREEERCQEGEHPEIRILPGPR